jgi:hypothetical protein
MITKGRSPKVIVGLLPFDHPSLLVIPTLILAERG